MAAIEGEHPVPIVKFRVHGKYTEPGTICKLRRKQLLRCGGEGGIRTHGTRKGSMVFETARFNHSRTSPNFHSSLFPDSIQQVPRQPSRWNDYLLSPLVPEMVRTSVSVNRDVWVMRLLYLRSYA